MSFGNALRMVTSGGPRLFRAARAAGASFGDAASVVAVSGEVLAWAAQRHPKEWRRQNAVRHFTWQALLTARYGRELAQAVALAQETGSNDRADSTVDSVNNRVGQEYGAAHASALAALSTGSALEQLGQEADRLWESRDLAASRRADGTDPRDPARER